MTTLNFIDLKDNKQSNKNIKKLKSSYTTNKNIN